MPVELSPKMHQAQELARAGRTPKAVVACWEAKEADPDDPLARALLAELLLSGDFYDQAIVEATEAIEKDPDFAAAYLVLGLAYDRRGGMWDQSVLVWHELAEVAPDLVTAHVQLGEAFFAADFQEEAIDAWNAALALDPHEARAMYNLAVAAMDREGPGTALPGFRRAGELDPSQDDFFLHLADVPEIVGEAPDPSTVARDREARLEAAGLLVRHEDYFGAADLARAVLDADPEDLDALAIASFAYLKQESDVEAMALALRAASINPDHAPALYCLGATYARRPGLDRQAARVWNALVRIAPYHPLPYVLLAEALMGLQRYRSATKAYRRAARLDPACVRARFGLAAAYLTEGRRAEARWETRRAAYYDTKRQDLFWRLWGEYVQAGDAS
jgi:tetratricopeptide (TPR) repeat protein